MADQTPLLSWQAPTHEYTERSPDWYWALGLLALAASILSIFFGNILLAVIIGLGAVIAVMLALRPPRMCDISITEAGIHVDQALYPYRSLTTFWVDEESRDIPQLIVTTNSLLNPQLILPLEEHVAVEDVRTLLLEKIEEKEQHESALSVIADLLGF